MVWKVNCPPNASELLLEKHVETNRRMKSKLLQSASPFLWSVVCVHHRPQHNLRDVGRPWSTISKLDVPLVNEELESHHLLIFFLDRRQPAGPLCWPGCTEQTPQSRLLLVDEVNVQQNHPIRQFVFHLFFWDDAIRLIVTETSICLWRSGSRKMGPTTNLFAVITATIKQTTRTTVSTDRHSGMCLYISADEKTASDQHPMDSIPSKRLGCNFYLNARVQLFLWQVSWSRHGGLLIMTDFCQ